MNEQQKARIVELADACISASIIARDCRDNSPDLARIMTKFSIEAFRIAKEAASNG